MFDTIILRVHDLRRHEQMVHELKLNSKWTTKNTAYLTEDQCEMIRKCETLDGKNFIEYFWNSKTGVHLLHYTTLNKINSSGHYCLNALVNDDRDFIEFNFSIPKYIFGTNIFMFCDHIGNKDFKYFINKSLDYNLKCTYDLLIKFIPAFFKREFFGTNIVDYSLVEVNRIDLAFNQVFHSKKNALDYLEYQKKIRKKHLRADSNSFRAYDTSLMYFTKRYSFKIYHKGTEYKKSDMKEHTKINIEKGKRYFNIDELQSFADKILRYEFTFRESMLSYIFNHNIFRKNCPLHMARYKIYKKIDSLKQKNDLIATNARYFPEGILRDGYLDAHPYHKIDRQEEIIFRKMSKLLNRQRNFFLKTNKSVEDFNTSSISGSFEPRALFSKALVIECAKLFKKYIMDFQVTKLPPEGVVKEKILKYNSLNYKKLPLNEMLKFFAIFRNSSFEEIMKTGPYSRATFYRYKKRFELIGITQNNIMPIDYIHPAVDLSLYHHHIIYGKSLKNK